ncbi:hypothetical protein Tco_1186495 [Tanacetum coccineum]
MDVPLRISRNEDICERAITEGVDVTVCLNVSGLVQPERSCAFSGLDAGMRYPDVIEDESTSSRSLSPLGAAASVSLLVLSESDVDEDSWITFSVVSSSVTMAFPFPTTSCSLGVASDTGSLIVTSPTGA